MRPLVQRLNIARGTASEEAGAQAACGDHNTYEDNVSWPPQMQENVRQENVEDALQAAYPHEPWSFYNVLQPPPAFGGFRAPAPVMHPAVRDESDDVYVTQRPRGRAVQQPPPKRKYGVSADQFLNDPRRQMSEQRLRMPQHKTWQESQQAAQDLSQQQLLLGGSFRHDMSLPAVPGMHGGASLAPRPPPRAFHAHRAHAPQMASAREDVSMYLTATCSDVVDEEVWQG